MIRPLLFVLCLLFGLPSNALTPTQITALKNGIVSIKSDIYRSAYNTMGKSHGTGFIVDKQKGFVITNRHVVTARSVGTYELIFANGREVDAKLVYLDPWHDFAFLQVDPKMIPVDSQALPLFEKAQLDEEVFIIGKNAGQDFSFQTGRISSLYEDMGHLPNQSLRISLNNRGGSSGSPVFNLGGQVVGLIHSSDMDSFGFALPIRPIKEALDILKQGKTPARHHTGALLTFYSLDRAARYMNFPAEKGKKYLEKYPQSNNKILMVKEVFEDTPAVGVLEPGDLVWSINGQEVGPHFFDLEAIQNNASTTVTYGIYRHGRYLEKTIGLYDLQQTHINRMVLFGGAIFYELNEGLRRALGASRQGVYVTNIFPGSPFYQVFPAIPGTEKAFARITAVDGHLINSLEELIKILPQVMGKRYICIEYCNYAVELSYDNFPNFSRNKRILPITLDESQNKAEVMTYNTTSHSWDITPLG
jgi:S1-C subfamily serine protease